jgi:hypothetical protein
LKTLKEKISNINGTVSKSNYTLWILYHSYFNGIKANIELQVYSLHAGDRTLLRVWQMHH